MAKGANQKQKLIRILDIIMRRTDEAHPMSCEQILSELERMGISAERKSFYDDINTLLDMQYDIVCTKGKNAGYFCGSHMFELAELKLLVDAVQSSKFITKKKSEELIKKINRLTDIYSAEKLKRQVCVENRVKTANESIFYIIDALQEAINLNRRISFKYVEWVLDFSSPDREKKSYRRKGEEYVADPWALVWADENYYLVAYDVNAGLKKHFRVDKMESVTQTGLARDRNVELERFNAADYEKKVFSMFGGEEQFVRLSFPNRLIGVVIDRFGKDIMLSKEDEGHFSAGVTVAVSPQFYGWVFALGEGARILSPEKAVRGMKEQLCNVCKYYTEEE